MHQLPADFTFAVRELHKPGHVHSLQDVHIHAIQSCVVHRHSGHQLPRLPGLHAGNELLHCQLHSNNPFHLCTVRGGVHPGHVVREEGLHAVPGQAVHNMLEPVPHRPVHDYSLQCNGRHQVLAMPQLHCGKLRIRAVLHFHREIMLSVPARHVQLAAQRQRLHAVRRRHLRAKLWGQHLPPLLCGHVRVIQRVFSMLGV